MGSVMKVVSGLIALMLIGSSALAQGFNDETKCDTIQKNIYAPSPEKEGVKELLEYIVQIMQALDHAHELKGDTAILPTWTVEGLSALAWIVIDRCPTRRDLSVADATIQTYETIRSMKPGLSLDLPSPMLASQMPAPVPGKKPESRHIFVLSQD